VIRGVNWIFIVSIFEIDQKWKASDRFLELFDIWESSGKLGNDEFIITVKLSEKHHSYEFQK